MSYFAHVFNIIIASPGDVDEERNIATEVIQEWNHIHSRKSQVILMPRRWETDSYPDMSNDAQTVINKQFAKDCDLLIGIFWSRLGSSTRRFASGTIEEIEEHLKAGKPAMIYISNRDIPKNHDLKQLEALKKIEKDFRSRGLIYYYTTFDDFRKSFTKHLAQKIYEEEKFSAYVHNDNTSNLEDENELTDLEIQILVFASKGNGMVRREEDGVTNNFSFELHNGVYIWKYDKGLLMFVDYLHAIKNLSEKGLLIEERIHFSLTISGFKKAMQFKDRKYNWQRV